MRSAHAWTSLRHAVVLPHVLVLLLAAAALLGCGQPGVPPSDAGPAGEDGGSTGADAGADAGAGAGTDGGGPVATHSAFGVFAGFTGEYAQFSQRMGFDAGAYQDWAGARYRELGAKWTRSNLQLVWDFAEPTKGGAFDWSASFGGDAVFAAAARHGVRYLAVFHEGGGDGAGGRPPLRDPVQDLEGWKRFARAAVERYDGDGVDDAPGGIAIHDWQLGNEIPAWTGSGRTAADYVRWVEAAAEAIHAADPDARLVLIAATGATTLDPFYRDVVRGLAAKGVRFDAIDLHHWGTASLADSRMSAVPELRALLADAGVDGVEVWSMEHGTYVGQPVDRAGTCTPACSATQACAPRPTGGLCVNKCTSSASCPPARPVCDTGTGLCGEPVQSQADQARSLVYRYAVNRALGVTLIDWNNLAGWRCFGGACGSYFDLLGLVADGWGPGEVAADAGKPRLSFHAYRALASRTDLAVAEVLPEVATGDAALHVYPYRHRATGKTGVVAWADSARPASLAWTGAQAHLTSLLTDAGGTSLRAETLAPAQGRVAVTLDETPVWISEDAAW